MTSHLNDVKRIVLDYVCGAGADVLACILEGTDVVLYVQPSQGLEQRLGDRLREAFKHQGLDFTVSMRIHAQNAVSDMTGSFGSGVIIYDPAGMVASLRNSMTAAANDNTAQSARWGAAAAAALVALSGLHAPSVNAEVSKSAMADAAMSDTSAPAVSGPNGKVAVEYNNYDGREGAILNGSFSMPLTHSFGMQVDAATGQMAQDTYNGFGGHLFWRDPSKGLVGLFGSSSDLDGEDMIRVGAEAKAYLNQVTLGARLARQHGNVDDGDIVRLSAGWYVTDDVLVEAYSERAAGVMVNKFAVEWQPEFAAAPGLAFFASSEQGGHNYDSTAVGARYYFGANKSLKNRHRLDDPESLVPDGSQPLIHKVNTKRNRTFGTPYDCGSFCPT